MGIVLAICDDGAVSRLGHWRAVARRVEWPEDQADASRAYAAGRLGCLLAQRADAVVRVFCGIPVYLKGAPNT